ncbi:TIGR02680 family protein [Microbacterium sp. LRZ72]|uniref:TIGR02680 family protein n=1 Tax=Microbacterium sp. LRZ72 TaxID=2942481 RepID=UPI0029A17F6F|nr:TIGR02680 family protein [Microbacterium sp. LRZ72]MDX2377875.1 TIGR02680 family protein [Microbacterium sp. LRZ72]
MTADALPRPTSERWQPLRVGLVDLFYYDDEQFWFHDGRLLLRGNNGTGKSKVLALTLPFLLDGSIASRRVEPDADPHKRMEWNLLLGGAHRHSERTGYSWAEFGRIEPDGSETFTTIGIGMKAASGRGIVKTWYFVSERRIGDLRLVDDSRTVISQERLRDELASSSAGHVFSTQDSYRRAVDEALFRLGDERYGALVDLLIQLRQPQLSKKPDEKALSAALTEALAPLDQAVVADVAESFRSLEEERIGIADAKDTLSAAEDFLRHYRAYSRIASRRHTTEVRLANSAYEHAGRSLGEARDRLTAARERVAALERDADAADERESMLGGQEEALRSSPEMRDADHLDRAGRDADAAEQRAAAAGTEAARAADHATRDAASATEAATQHDEAVAAEQRHERAAMLLATAAGLSEQHPEITADAEAAASALASRRSQVTHVRALADAAAHRVAAADNQRRALDSAEADAAARAEELAEARDAVERAVAMYRDGVREWLAAVVVVDAGRDLDELADLSEGWARTQSAEPPARLAIDAAADAELERITHERSAAEQEAGLLDADLAAVRAEIAERDAGRDPEPQPTPARAHDAREQRRGAPFWRLTDFAADVPDTQCSGIEAALQSAGLLDAWVSADGTVRVDDDVVLESAGPEIDSPQASLATVLVPAVPADSVVASDTVQAVLRRIGWGETSGAHLWIDGDGRWGTGPLRGAWTKERAEFVGASARDAHRREVLERLHARAGALESQLDAVRDSIAEAGRRAQVVRQERASYPASLERRLFVAHGDAAAAEREQARATERADAARWAWDDADGAAHRAAEQLAEEAADLALPTAVDDLERLREAIGDYEVALTHLRASAHARVLAGDASMRADERAADSSRVRERREEEHGELRGAATRLRAAYDALHATVGESVAELQARLTEVAAARTSVAAELKQLAKDRLAASAEEGTAAERVDGLVSRREEASLARDERIGDLRRFVATGLLRVAVREIDTPAIDEEDGWNVSASVALARAVEQRLADIDESDEAWARSQQRVSTASTELSSQMSRHGHTAVVEQHGDVLVERVRYRGDEIDIDRLADRLSDDVADRERLLSAREREILEEHLVGEVAGHLHERILTAEQQIDRMNRELAERKTSTGMRLRVRWRERPDGPAGLAAARGLLVRSDATWSADDRTAIEDFLQARIAEVREDDPAGGWQEHLGEALDYRRWHGFVVERWQNGQWRSASGPASGGERALAVSVPLFAAAAAHYNSADPRAPRLILLDEAFAGVDDDSRAKSLGLLATFDLDVVMTSEREWGCYPQVPGLSIAQLTRVEGIDAVGVTRWRWDGRQKTRAPQVDASGQAGGPPPEPEPEMLFG